MEVTISKTMLDETIIREGVKSLLYEATMNSSHDFQVEVEQKTLQGINPPSGLSLMAAEDLLPAFVQTKFRYTVRTVIDKINYCAPAISTEINGCQLHHTKTTLILIKILKGLCVKMKSEC